MGEATFLLDNVFLKEKKEVKPANNKLCIIQTVHENWSLC